MIVEIILIGLIILFEFVSKGYQKLSNDNKAIVRAAIMVPLFASLLFDFRIESLILFLIYCVILMADIVLLYNLTIGAVIFILAHIFLGLLFFSGFQILPLGIIIVADLLFYLFALKKKDFDWKVILYLSALSWSVWQGISTGNLYIIIGMILFYLCDLEVIYTETIGEFKYYQPINHALYYGALTLIVAGIVWGR